MKKYFLEKYQTSKNLFLNAIIHTIVRIICVKKNFFYKNK